MRGRPPTSPTETQRKETTLRVGRVGTFWAMSANVFGEHSESQRSPKVDAGVACAIGTRVRIPNGIWHTDVFPLGPFDGLASTSRGDTETDAGRKPADIRTRWCWTIISPRWACAPSSPT